MNKLPFNLRGAIPLGWLSVLATGLLPATGTADTLLFPVLTSSGPQIRTLVSVINRPGGSSPKLNLIYRYKSALGGDGLPNLAGGCETTTASRATFAGDLVSWDVSGTMDGGQALFGDTNAYGGSFGLGVQGPQRGYLLVTHADNGGNRQALGQPLGLAGEFVNLDVGGGAAWGGRAINDRTREDDGFLTEDNGGGVYSALPSNYWDNRRFTFFPADTWTTRFYVTPIGAGMANTNLTASVQLGGNEALYDRQGNIHNFTPIPRAVTCTGALDLPSLVDSAVWAAVEHTGGWTWFQVSAGSAIVYKLEYSSASTYGGTVNNGYLLSDYALP